MLDRHNNLETELKMIVTTRRFRTWFVSATLLAASPLAFGQMGCVDPFTDGSSPSDYRTASAESRGVVERRHFTDDVRMMRRGESTNQIAADIAYTLRKFPNHYQALMTMGDYSLKVKRNPPRVEIIRWSAGSTARCASRPTTRW